MAECRAVGKHREPLFRPESPDQAADADTSE